MADGDHFLYLGKLSPSEKEIDKYWNKRLPLTDRISNFYYKNIKPFFSKKQKTIEASVL